MDEQQTTVDRAGLEVAAAAANATARTLNRGQRQWPEHVGQLVTAVQILSARAGICPWGDGPGGSAECLNHCTYGPGMCTVPGALESWGPAATHHVCDPDWVRRKAEIQRELERGRRDASLMRCAYCGAQYEWSTYPLSTEATCVDCLPLNGWPAELTTWGWWR